MKYVIRKLFIALILLAMSVCLVSCAEKTIKIGFYDLESGCIEEVIERDKFGVYLEFRLKKGCGVTELKEDFEARYGGDERYSFTEVNHRVLAISHTALNKFDKRVREGWMFEVENHNYVVWGPFSRLSKTANDTDHSGQAFYLPIKYMDYPELLYIGYDEQHKIYVYENVKYAVHCGFAELKTYYERLGFYQVAEEGENTLLLTLNRQDDDLAQYNDREFEKSVRLVFEPIEPRGNGGITGYFRAETVPLYAA